MEFVELITDISERAGLKVMKMDGHYVKCSFGLADGRSQTVHMFHAGELGHGTVVRISTPVLELPTGELPGRVAEGLLRENALMKVGSFCVEEIQGHKLLTIHHNMVLETLDPEELMIVVGTLAVTGDKWEQQLGGGDRF